MNSDFNFPQKLHFGLLPTPIQSISKFFDFNKNYRGWIKRDDLTGLELTGNKVRKLEYIVAAAKASGCKHLISCGGVQSNHCRTVAFLAAQMQYKCTLFLKGNIPDVKSGNYLLNSILDANIINVTNEEYQTIDARMKRFAEENCTDAYVVPEGGSNEIGVWGYIECFFEIEKQIKQQNLKIDTIVIPTGSGGTHAGLLLGKFLAKSKINIISINVCDTAEFFVNKIQDIISKFNTINKLKLEIKSEDINIIDGFVGQGYGIISNREVDIIKRFAQAESIIIDPVYTAKALVGLEENIKNNSMPGNNILFIHTGGLFGLFAISDLF